MKADLGLSAEVADKIKAILKDAEFEARKIYDEAVAASAAQPDAKPAGMSQEVRQRLEDLSKKVRGQVMALLTPEQRAKVEQIEAQRRAAMPKRPGATEPQPATKGYGTST